MKEAGKTLLISLAIVVLFSLLLWGVLELGETILTPKGSYHDPAGERWIENPVCVKVTNPVKLEHFLHLGNWTTMIETSDGTVVVVPKLITEKEVEGFYVVNSIAPKAAGLGPYQNCPLKE